MYYVYVLIYINNNMYNNIMYNIICNVEYVYIIIILYVGIRYNNGNNNVII